MPPKTALDNESHIWAEAVMPSANQSPSKPPKKQRGKKSAEAGSKEPARALEQKAQLHQERTRGKTT